MRKSILLIASVVLVLAGCAKENISDESFSDSQQVHRPVIEVGIAKPLSKVTLGQEMDGKFPLIWNEGDEIAVVENMGKQGQNYSIYRLKSGAGTSNGKFEYVSGTAYPKVITDVVYPASAMKPSNVEMDKNLVGDLNSIIPVNQNYTEGSFDPRAAIMSYHNESGMSGPIILSPASCIVCIPLKGKPGDVISSLVWKHMDGHTRTFTLNCPAEGVQLSDKPVFFYIAIPKQYYDAESPDKVGKTANAIVYANLKNGAVQVKTLKDKSWQQGELRRYPEWTMSKKTQWSFVYVGTQRDDATWHGVPMGPAKYMIDDNELSWWEFKRVLNEDKSGPKMEKHFKFIIDLGSVQHITGLKFKAKEDKTSPKYGITNNSGTDIYGSQSYNPPYNVKTTFVKDLEDPNVKADIDEFKKFPDSKNWKAQEEHHCTSTNGIAHYYGVYMKQWWSYDLKKPVDARYIIMHVSHGWNNTGNGSAASMLKIAEFDIY